MREREKYQKSEGCQQVAIKREPGPHLCGMESNGGGRQYFSLSITKKESGRKERKMFTK